MTITWSVAIDFDNDGSFATAGDDISAYVENAPTRVGIGNPNGIVADEGSCLLTVKNADRRFSPLYSLGPYYGKLLPLRPIRVQATDGTSTWPLFRGFVKSFRPSSGQYLDRTCEIACADFMTILKGFGLNMRLQQNQTGDVLIRAIVNSALGAPAAGATITLTANPSNNDSVTINGSAYTFKTTLTGAAFEVLIGASNTATAQNLTDAINTAAGIGSTYGSGTTQHPTVSASLSSNVVTLTALLAGNLGNAYTLAKSGANISISGATFSGGADYPTSPAPSYQVGREAFTYAGDTWDNEATSAETAISDVTRAEQGLFWIARDGTITWKNRDYLFKQVTSTKNPQRPGAFENWLGVRAPIAAITPLPYATTGGMDYWRVKREPVGVYLGYSTGQLVANSQPFIDGQLDDALIFNFVQVKYTPRSALSSGVVAQAKNVIQVPGQSGTERWNGTVALPGGGAVTVKLPFVDPTSGLPMGVTSLITPLAATTDWTANEVSDGSGVSYTGNSNLKFSIVINGANCEVSIKNTALGPLYITMLKIRGVGIVRYNPTTFGVEDTTSQALYQKKRLTLELPFPVSQNFAASLAQYLLNHYKDPNYRLFTIDFGAQQTVGGFNLLALEIGDVIVLTDYQAGLSASKHIIMGMEYTLVPGSGTAAATVQGIRFYVRRLDDVTYWILGDPIYGELGITTRLGI